MIKSLYLEGFKSFGKPVKIDFRDITLLYGENSSGKSSILQALQYAREVFCNGNLDCLTTEIGGDFVNLKGFDNFVHGKRAADGHVKIGVHVTPDDEDAPLNAPREIDCGRIRSLLTTAIDDNLHPSMSFALQSLSDPIHYGNKNATVILPTGCDVETFGITVKIRYRSESQLHVTSVWFYINDSEVLFIGEDNEGLNDSDETRSWQQNKVNIFHHHAVYPGSYDALTMDHDAKSKILPDKSMDGWQQRINLLDLAREGFLHFPFGELGELESLLRHEANAPKHWLDELYLELIERDMRHRKDIAVPMFFAFASFSACTKSIHAALSKMLYIGPLRSHYTIDDSAKPLTQKHRPGAWANGIGAWHCLEDGKTFCLNLANDWVQRPDRFGFDCIVSNAKNRISEFSRTVSFDNLARQAFDELVDEIALLERVLLFTRDGIMLTSTDLGVGFSQVLPIIVAAVEPTTKDKCILLEQPELHIHARLQAVLGDLLATGKGSRQFIIETHSEFLLLRLMRRIRETTKKLPSDGPRLHCDNVAIYHVKKVDGCSQVQKLELDTLGNLTDYWPDDLFDLSFKEQFGE